MVESQPSKLAVRVRFPSPAPVDPHKVSVVRRAQWIRQVRSGPVLAAAARLGAPIEPRSVSVAIWDMLAAGAAGLLSGRYGQEQWSGPALPADLLKHLDEVGGRRYRPPGTPICEYVWTASSRRYYLDRRGIL